MFHCPYLLYKIRHKLLVWPLFCVPRVTDCSIRVSRSFTEGLQSPCPPSCYTCDYEIYNIATQPYYFWWTHSYCIEIIAPRPTYVFIVWKEDASLLAMFNLLCSSTNQLRFKRIFVIKVATMKITDDLMEAITCLSLYWHFSWWKKMNGTQRRAVISPWRTHCMYSGMVKGTSWAEATLNNEKIRPVALAIVELRESEGIRQAVSQSVENSIKYIYF